MKLLKNFLKGLVIIIAVICVAFTAFFVLAAASGHTDRIDKVERGIFALVHASGLPIPGAVSESTSSVSLLTNQYGLTTSQAGQVLSIAEQLGVDVDNPSEVSGFVAKNIGNKDQIQDIVEKYQAGSITESEAKAMLARIVNV